MDIKTRTSKLVIRYLHVTFVMLMMLLMVLQTPQTIYAQEMSENDRSSIYEETPFYDDSCSPVTDASLPNGKRELENIINKLAEENKGTTAIAVDTVGEDSLTEVNGSKQMATRSTYKIYVAYAILKAIKEKKLTWGNVSRDFNDMIVNSGNESAERLRLNPEVGGPSGITKLLQDEVGLSKNTVMGTGSSSNPKGTDSQSTANDFVKFLKMLEERKLPGLGKDDEGLYKRLLDAMERQTGSTEGIKKGVGNETKVANKPGWGPAPGAATNDVGIVYASKKYTIAILTDYGNNNWTYVAKIAREVHAAMIKIDRNGETSVDGGVRLGKYDLPATKGGTGLEEPITSAGNLVGKSEKVTFSKHASLGQEYQDYYITMRWNYVKWNWNGTATNLNNSEYNWFNEKPRLVLVTNPQTKKSIVAVALEAGPAPWTGVDSGPNNNPKQGWSNPQRGTPSGYKGRVSGLPPKAFEALGMTSADQKTAGDQGPDLQYAWAADQSVKPGPTDDTVTTDTSVSDDGSQCVCTTIGTSNAKAGVVTGTMKDFIKNYGQAVFDTGKKYGIPYDAILAQAGLESAWGKAVPGGNSNNLFGIKAYPGWKGEVVSSGTLEDMGGGNMTGITANFIKFKSIEEGIEGYAQFIHRNERYKKALKHPNDPIKYLKEIKNAGYATDSSYIPKLLDILKTTQTYIKDNNLFPPSSEVQADGAAAPIMSSGSGGEGGCPSESSGSAVASDIVKTAIDLSWPDASHGTKPKPEYSAAIMTHNPGLIGQAADCGVFVSTVMRASGADKKYPKAGTFVQEPYMKDSSKYEYFAGGTIKSTADLQPGDILVVNKGSGSGGAGHIVVWLGENSTGKNIASASLGSRAGNLGNMSSMNDSLGRGWYAVGRLK